ncbi:MAG: ABC transporter ATP-binding protein [Candidatus Saccharimonadales bacterium]|nr:ABC transporter ATP-binding protein [Candidatus Saccharimonadales bacterium]
MSAIELKQLTKRYKQGTKVINACDAIDLKVKEGEFVVIIGPSGSGKSTLLQQIGGLDYPTSGKVILEGKDLSKMSEAKLTKYRSNNIGYVFQNFNLVPTLNAEQNVEVAISNRTKSDGNKVRNILDSVGLESRYDHLPSLLSGGEQQRVAIARSLVNNPKIILADEPTGNLDSKTGTEIMQLLAKLNKDQGKTVIVITHSVYVRKFADRFFELIDGKLNEITKGSHLSAQV